MNFISQSTHRIFFSFLSWKNEGILGKYISKGFFFSFGGFFFFFSLLSVQASSQVFLEPDTKFYQKAQTTLLSPEKYKWSVLSSTNDVLATYLEEEFVHIFSDPGVYRITLVVTDESGESEKTHTDVIVGDSRKNNASLSALFQSLPSSNSSNELFVSPESPVVFFFAGESHGGVKEFWIDTDISIDSDADGDPANDKDNISHKSFVDGSLFRMEYSDVSQSLTARLTVVDFYGKKDTSDLVIHFSKSILEGMLLAKASCLPECNESGEIFLTGKEQKFAFFLGESTGNIIQYRIDTDISVDSDGDGDPANDIDNLHDPSFSTGVPFLIHPSKQDQDVRIIQAIVVSPAGKGSRIQRKVSVKPQQSVDFERVPDMNPRLIVNRTEADIGEPIIFHILGTPPEATYVWDFDGDGEIDISGASTDQSYIFSSSGDYMVEVIVVLGERQHPIQQSITVKKSIEELIPPEASFRSHIGEDGRTVSFENFSSASSDLEHQTLQYEWNFGDGNTSTEKDPGYTYSKNGEYTVLLKVTDSMGISAKVQENILLLVKNGEEEWDDDDEGEEEDPKEMTEKTEFTADFEFTKQENEVQFMNLSLANSELEDRTLQYGWDFGDGNTSTEKDPEHTYGENGEYTVLLKVTDSTGETREFSHSFQVGKVISDPKPVTGGQSLQENTSEGEEESSFPWGTLFIVLCILILGGIGIVLFLRKVESPEMGFREIFLGEIMHWTNTVRNDKEENRMVSPEKKQQEMRGEIIKNESISSILVSEEKKEKKEEEIIKDKENNVKQSQKTSSDSSHSVFRLEEKNTVPEKEEKSGTFRGVKDVERKKEEPNSFPISEKKVPSWLKDAYKSSSKSSHASSSDGLSPSEKPRPSSQSSKFSSEKNPPIFSPPQKKMVSEGRARKLSLKNERIMNETSLSSSDEEGYIQGNVDIPKPRITKNSPEEILKSNSSSSPSGLSSPPPLFPQRSPQEKKKPPDLPGKIMND
jgi:PKD repeat protein